MLDRHGKIDILSEKDWLNIQLSHHRGIDFDENELEIVGCSFNTLILGICIYHGYLKPSSEELFGGLKCWQKTIETVLVMLPKTCTIPEVMVRFVHLLDCYIAEEDYLSKNEEELDDLVERNPLDLSNLCFGALNFLKYWVMEYVDYFVDVQLNELEMAVSDMCMRLNANERVRNLPNVSDDDGISMLSHEVALIDTCASMCLKLKDIINKAAIKRSWNVRGYNAPEFKLNVFSRFDIGIASLNSHHCKNSVSPSVPYVSGDWYGASKIKNVEKFKDAVAANEKHINMIGGANALLNYDSEESDEDDLPQGDDAAPQTRVAPGTSLLESPSSLDFWLIDPLELARQWTLTEHCMFQAIPANSMLYVSWQEPRHKLAATPVRRFIDRFNSVSNWATSSILTGQTPQNRAQIFEYIVKIAHNFHLLNNFNGLMALLTGLQRGCINRLTHMLDEVSKGTKENLKRLLGLMSGSKNYLVYRQMLANFTNDKTSIGGFIPHLGAHLAELSTIDEGNLDHMSNAPHLLNISKLKLTARTVTLLTDLQKYSYKIRPVRMIASTIDKALQRYVYLTNAEVADNDRRLYELSLYREEIPQESQESETDEGSSEVEDDEAGDGDDDDDDDDDDEEDVDVDDEDASE